MKKVLFSFVIFFLFNNALLAQTYGNDGKNYRTFQVSGYEGIWMAQNLNASEFRNGDIIPQAKNSAEWRKAAEKKQPAWCYYNYDPTNESKYGKLYNWYAVKDSRGLAPNGWHIPTIGELEGLVAISKGSRFAGSYMKSEWGWDGYNDATNKSGFSGLPGGYCSPYGSSSDIKTDGYWWSYSEKDQLNSWYITMNWNDSGVDISPADKKAGFSVRCKKD